MRKLIFITMVILVSCRDEKIITENNKDVQNLQSYILNNSDKQISNNLIACAASSNRELFHTSSAFPVSILLLPTNSATDFNYFEMNNNYHPKEDLENYFKNDTKSLPMFNGFLRIFLQRGYAQDYWSNVTFLTDDSLHISNAIRIKHYSKPTKIANEIIEFSLPEPNKPLFSWESDPDKENIIYFQVITTPIYNEDSVISATYTYEKHFQFYDLSNVVLNVHNIDTPPELKLHKSYRFTLMGISEDNWVNLIAAISFNTFGSF